MAGARSDAAPSPLCALQRGPRRPGQAGRPASPCACLCACVCVQARRRVPSACAARAHLPCPFRGIRSGSQAPWPSGPVPLTWPKKGLEGRGGGRGAGREGRARRTAGPSTCAPRARRFPRTHGAGHTLEVFVGVVFPRTHRSGHDLHVCYPVLELYAIGGAPFTTHVLKTSFLELSLLHRLFFFNRKDRTPPDCALASAPPVSSLHTPAPSPVLRFPVGDAAPPCAAPPPPCVASFPGRRVPGWRHHRRGGRTRA